MEKAELFKLTRENMEWLKEKYDDLKRKYDNRWIIVKDRQVVESRRTFDEILEAIKKYDRNTVIVEYIQREKVAMFF